MISRALGLTFLLCAACAACTGAVGPGHGDGGDGDAVDSGTQTTIDGGGGGGGTGMDAGEDDAGRPQDGGSEQDGGTAQDAGADAGLDAGPPGTPYVFVGGGNRIFVFTLDEQAGTLTPQGGIDAGNPSFLAFDPQNRWLYAVRERTPGTVGAYRIDPSNGALTFINEAGSGGNGPAHVNVDQSGKWVLAANYGSGTVAILPVGSDGGLSTATDTAAPGVKAHQILASKSNAFVFVPCLGDDLVAQYIFDSTAGTLTPNAVPSAGLPNGAGPRHMDFHPTLPFAYVINELNSTLTACDYDAAQGRLTPKQTVSTLPVNFNGPNTSAEVVVHPNGKYVYGSNRGHNSIAIFRIDAASGQLTPLGHQSTGGNTPRSFALNDDGTLLLAANQGSNTVHAFQVDPATGVLTALGQVASVPSPTYVGIRRLKAP